jgi:S-adenosylmethionine decarboxylase
MVGFTTENETSFAGRHLLVDLYGCSTTLSPVEIQISLEGVCREIGATVLFSHAHEFNNGGSSGVVILAESHATWHHWIEEGFIALDIFVCGECRPENAMNTIKDIFKPTSTISNTHLRGVYFDE